MRNNKATDKVMLIFIYFNDNNKIDGNHEMIQEENLDQIFIRHE